MTAAVIRKWGNSLALRIPREIAAVLAIEEATEVELRAIDGRLVIEPRAAPEYSLDDMLSASRPAHFRRHQEDKAWLDDRPAGREAL